MEEGTRVFACAACNRFATQSEWLLAGHQAECSELEESKRQFRFGVLVMTFGSEDRAQQVVALARTHDSTEYLAALAEE